jgi:hypothetical protein
MKQNRNIYMYELARATRKNTGESFKMILKFCYGPDGSAELDSGIWLHPESQITYDASELDKFEIVDLSDEVDLN